MIHGFVTMGGAIAAAHHALARCAQGLRLAFASPSRWPPREPARSAPDRSSGPAGVELAESGAPRGPHGYRRPALDRRRIVKAACPHDCPDTCAMDVTVENGVAVDIHGGDMPFTDGVLCTKVAKYLDRTYSKDRVLHPMRRVGGKGPGRGGSSASRGTRRSTRSPRGSRRSPPRTRSRSSRAATPGRWACCSTGRWTGASSTGWARACSTARSARRRARPACKLTLGGSVGHGPRAVRRGEAHPDLGLEPDRLQPALVVALPGGEAARREARRDRSLAEPDRREVPPARRAPAGHRRRARARDDERHHRRGSASTATTSSGTRSASTSSPSG